MSHDEMARPVTAVRRGLSLAKSFLASETAGGFVLVLAALAGLALANSPYAAVYFQILSDEYRLGSTALSVSLTVPHIVNDGLMTLFFLLVGLEIKRALRVGELSSRSQALLPAIGAIGGMIAPAALFLVTVWGQGDMWRGWAIPTATDIAFALAAISLVRRYVSPGLVVFLSALAIIDDLGAILVIALWYTETINWFALVCAGLALALLVILNLAGVRRLPGYLALGCVLWWFVLQSGIHPTLAGVLLASTIPIGAGQQPLARLERALHGPVALFVVPLFGFVNAGVALGSVGLDSLTHKVTLGIILGLVAGKPLGIMTSCWLATRLQLARLPVGARFAELFGVSLLCGIGFTMSLFLGSLAFASLYTTETKLGILLASLIAVVAGYCWLRGCALLAKPDQATPDQTG